MESPVIAGLVLAGVLAGTTGGLFGIGGGVISVSAAMLLLGVDIGTAVAISLVVMAVATPIGLLTHHRAGNVRWRTGALLGFAGLFGILLASQLESYLPDQYRLWAFGILILSFARPLIYGATPNLPVRGPGALAAVGVLAGFIAKLFGIGGGLLIVPTLVFTGHTIHVAVATSLVTVFLNGAASSAWNLLEGSGTWWIPAVPLGAGSVAGTYLGSRAALRTHADVLRRLYGFLLLAVTFVLILRSG